MNINNKKAFRWCKLFALTTALSTTLASCDKMLDVESRHIVNEENKWQDINDARASLMGIYGLVRSALAENNAHWAYGDLRAGDFVSSSRRDLKDIIDGNLKSSHKLIVNLSNWRKFYAAINAANLFIEKSGQIVKSDPQYTERNNRIDVAQARALKGFCYFLMARIWGSVPIWDKSYEGTFPSREAQNEDVILAYAENELKAAMNVLPYVYGSLNDEVYPVEYYHGYKSENWNGVLFNRLSVNAILAHLTAWSGKYLESSVFSEFVLSNASKSGAAYVATSTFTTSDGFFYNSSNSQLVAFPFKWTALEASFEGHIEQLTLAAPLVTKPIPDIYITPERIVEIFNEDKDSRFYLTTDGQAVSSYFSEFGSIRPIFSKIKVIRAGSNDGSFPLFSSVLVFSRLEDIALLRAEALGVLGEEELARNILNQIRKSRGLSESNGTGDIIYDVFQERRRELMGEGWRWFDLVRYNKLKRTNTSFNKLIDEKGVFWPIAEDVLSNNKNLKQNPYWNNPQ